MMTRDEEKYWANQPESVINAEMERRLNVYLKKKNIRVRRYIKDTKRYKQAALDRACDKMGEVIDKKLAS